MSDAKQRDEAVVNRSWLFMPAEEQRFYTKIRELNADAYVLDLEDAVYRTRKEAARSVLTQLDVLRTDKAQLAVRVNPLSTKWGRQDVVESLRAGIKIILYPKVDSPEEVIELQDLIRRNHPKPDEVEIVPIIETLDGLGNAESIIQASPQIRYVVFGSEDFLADCGITLRGFIYDNPLLSHALAQLSMLCSEHQKWLIDCAVPLFESPEEVDSFRRECEYSRRAGARGKLAIHPRQVDHINEIYGYESLHQLPEMVEKLTRIAEQMQEREKSAIRFEDHLVGIPEVRKYIKQIDMILLHASKKRASLLDLKESLEEVLPDDET